MASPTNYEIDFLKNTQLLFEHYYEIIKDGIGLEVTFLINCLLGFIVIVYEKHIDNVKDKFLSDFPRIVRWLPSRFEISDSNKSRRLQRTSENLNEVSMENFLKRLRDGISHQHITAHPSDGVHPWNSVTINDYYVSTGQPDFKNFEIELTIEQLKNIAIEISNLIHP